MSGTTVPLMSGLIMLLCSSKNSYPRPLKTILDADVPLAFPGYHNAAVQGRDLSPNGPVSPSMRFNPCSSDTAFRTIHLGDRFDPARIVLRTADHTAAKQGAELHAPPGAPLMITGLRTTLRAGGGVLCNSIRCQC